MPEPTPPELAELQLELATSFMLSQGKSEIQADIFGPLSYHHYSRGPQHQQALESVYERFRNTPPLDLPAGHKRVSELARQDETKIQAINYHERLTDTTRLTPDRVAESIAWFISESLDPEAELAYAVPSRVTGRTKEHGVGNDPHDSFLRKFILLERRMPTPALTYFYGRRVPCCPAWCRPMRKFVTG